MQGSTFSHYGGSAIFKFKILGITLQISKFSSTGKLEYSKVLIYFFIFSNALIYFYLKHEPFGVCISELGLFGSKWCILFKDTTVWIYKRTTWYDLCSYFFWVLLMHQQPVAVCELQL